MPYKVLNVEGEKVVVDQIDPTIHKHLSGRDFNENDACVKGITLTEDNIVEIIDDAREKLAKQEAELRPVYIHSDVTEVDTVEEIEVKLTLQEAKEAYKEKYGAYPKGNPKLETIISKL